jgi:hypothetical protein
MLITASLALLMPVLMIAWWRWQKSVSTVYVGPATMEWKDKSVANSSKFWAFFKVPNLKRSLMVDMSQARFNSAMIFTECQLVVKKRPFSEAWVEQVTWQDGTVETPKNELALGGMVFTLLYMMLAFAWVLIAKDNSLGTIGYLAAGLSIAMGGFIANMFRFTGKDLKAAPMSLLRFIKMGNGTTGLLLGALVMGGLTAACFWQPSFLMFFPGINCAFEFGGITALLVTALGDKSSGTPAATSAKA